MVAILLIFDGLGDREHPNFDRKTPLEYASTPNMDALAREGAMGMFVSVGVGMPPGSAAAMLSILGYDPIRENPGRGVLDALGAGIYAPGALAARANLATVKEGRVVDRRAGRLSDPQLLKRIESELNSIHVPGADVRFKITLHYRGVLVLKPKKVRASADLLSNDPEDPEFSNSLSVLPKTARAKKTAELLNHWLSEAKRRLEEIPSNSANYVILRGFGVNYPAVQPFEEKMGVKLVVVSGLTYLKGIARMIKAAPVEISEENMEKNVRDLLRVLEDHRNRYDLFVTHIKATDVYGHDGDFLGKVNALEYLDEHLVGPLMEILNLEHDVVAITGDHSTPVTEKRHTGDPVPLLVAGRGVRKDRVQEFGEHACMNGGLGLLRGPELVRMLVDLIGKSKRVGA